MLGVGGVLFRTVQLFFIKDVQTGLVWATKILTDPFHDIKLYHKAPLALLRGELIDPGIGVKSRSGKRKKRSSTKSAAADISTRAYSRLSEAHFRLALQDDGTNVSPDRVRKTAGARSFLSGSPA